MSKINCGDSKLVLRYLGFLIEEYKLTFVFNTYEDYLGFKGPIYAYSFYNQSGCFTLHHVVQRGEIGWFVSKTVSSDQYDLLEEEIDQNSFIQIHNRSLSFKTHLKILREIIVDEIKRTDCFFGIKT